MKLESTAAPDLLSPELRRRAQIHAADELTLLLVRDGANEVGIVVLDFTTGDEDQAILVEIYVRPALRSRGVGHEVLRLAEAFARDRECAWMILDAEPLEDDDDNAKERLIGWYERQGYQVLGAYDHLGKHLNPS